MAFSLVNWRKLLAPEKCLICERRPTDLRWVDTGFRSDKFPAKHPLRGRKYICEACGEKTGKALAMLTSVQSAALKADIEEKEAEIARLQGDLDLQGRMDALRADLAPILPLPEEVADEVEDPDPA